MDPDPSAYPPLKFLSDFEKVEKTCNRLPHWQQDRTTYFLSFRLADSIPSHLLDAWRAQRSQWLLEHPKPWQSEIEVEYRRRFTRRIDQLLDQGHGDCLLRDPTNAACVAGAFGFFDHVRYLLHSWVIMPNHVHLLCSLAEASALGRTIADWKSLSARQINRCNQRSGRVWQKDYFDRSIRDWDHFINAARYIRRNPAKAHLPAGSFASYEAPWVARLLG